MLPVSDPPLPESLLQPLKKSISPEPRTHRSTLRSLISVHPPRIWLLVGLVSIQIFLLLVSQSLPISFTASRRDFSPPITVSAPNSSAAGKDQCSLGRIYVYDLPQTFNIQFLENCDNLNPWSSRCDAMANRGLGPQATGLAGIVPESLAPAWHWTDQFVSEIIFHNRILNHPCRTAEPDSAAGFYIPFYAGLAVGKYLWSNYSAKDRDRYCEMMLGWVQEQPQWKRSDGWDHFLTMGRITWDFRRSDDRDWGSRCIHMPGMRNVTRLLIERNSWDYFDVGVPYPTSFHPRTDSDVLIWQDHVRRRVRTTLFCFAGASRASIKNDFRGLLLTQCRNEPGFCREVNCSGTSCSNGTSEILETFLSSDFCLQPRGDSFTRRSIFDCMVAGSIPVFFWNRTAYSQYEWFLPGEPGSYSVFIDREEVEKGVSIRGVLEKYSAEEVRKMREKVIEYIPRLVYAKAEEGLENIKDAFDVAIVGLQMKQKVKWIESSVASFASADPFIGKRCKKNENAGHECLNYFTGLLA